MAANNPINSTTRNPNVDRAPIAPKNGERENSVMRAVTSLMVCRRREVMSYCGVTAISL